ncbi:unnamed protein product [Symbiodinium sp. CCMP2592]|nr:unnamed protein product [Symbiodinium sp. CCMP2592]
MDRLDMQASCRQDWILLAEKQQAILGEYCIACTQWCSPQKGGLKSHIRRSHADMWQHHDAVTKKLKAHSRLKYKGPCRACSFKPQGPMAEPSKEVTEFFGHHLPSLAAQHRATGSDDRQPKWPRPSNKGKGPDQSRTKRERDWWVESRDWKEPLTQQIDGNTVRNVLAIVTKLSLRQEDDIAAMRADSSFLMYMTTTGTSSMATTLFAISQEWKELKAQTPPKVTLSLRVTLLVALLKEFQARLAQATEGETKERLQAKGHLTKQDPPCWTFSRWDAEQQKSIIDSAQIPLAHSLVVQNVERLIHLVEQDALIHKFHATRPLAQQYQSDILTFLLAVGNRGEAADQLYSTLLGLCNNNCTHLIGVRLCRERVRRQPLAKVLQAQADALLKATQPQYPSAPATKTQDAEADMDL